MNAATVAHAIEGKTRELLSGLNADLKTNLGTSHYHRLSEAEILNRGSAVFQGLTQWLVSRDELALQKYAEDLGKRRFTEGIPLGQVVLAQILIEKHIGVFLESCGQPVEEDVRRAITECFQKIVYYTAKGYEESLAVSNRLAKRAAVEQPVLNVAALQAPPKKEPGKDESDMQISRGGQVGEFGG